MRYHITHTLTYEYDRPVLLEPHILRLRPRSDSWQTLHSFQLTCDPPPQGMGHNIDLEGNNTSRLWFVEPTRSLHLSITSEVETLCTNPFAYTVEPWALHFPIDYPASMQAMLQPYLAGDWGSVTGGFDPVVAELAETISYTTQFNPTLFVTELTQQIYRSCQYITRDLGDPLPPGITWKQKTGSCRDFAVLFMAACRAVGLAARFVSGYQEGDPDSDRYDLHAWAEVYLPGAGWRGYDPTHGLAVGDRHIALVASVNPRYTAPCPGGFRGGKQVAMNYTLDIRCIEGGNG